MKKIESAQRNYISTNYTFIARDLIDNGVNVIAQLVSESMVDGVPTLSLSCNADILPDLLPMIHEKRRCGASIALVAQVHEELPFMVNDALIESKEFDYVIRNNAYNTRLFAPPNLAVSAQDYATGFHASSLIADGGTLQIGIGSLSDSVVYATCLRNQHNNKYCNIIRDLQLNPSTIEDLNPFVKGLYACSEMFVNGFRYLIDAGIVKRGVVNDLSLQSLLNDQRLSLELKPNTLQVLLDVGVINKELTSDQLTFLKYWGILSQDVELIESTIKVGEVTIVNDLSISRNCEQLLNWRSGHR